jgi:copper chaperone CopZ
MNIKINKNLLLPGLIIVVALLIGGNLLLSDNLRLGTKSQTVSSQNLRVLTLSIPGMVCSGCAASIESYVKAMSGVTSASVLLNTKSGIFVYDPYQITKEEIVKNTIFDIYPPTIVSDEPYDPSIQQLAQPQTPAIPLEIQQKSNRVSQLLSQKKSSSPIEQEIQLQLNEVEKLLLEGNYQQAGQILDKIISDLESI